MRAILTVFAKEFLENLRDRRTVHDRAAARPAVRADLLRGDAAALAGSIARGRRRNHRAAGHQSASRAEPDGLPDSRSACTSRPVHGDEAGARAAIAHHAPRKAGARSARRTTPRGWPRRRPAALRLYSDSSRTGDERYVDRVAGLLAPLFAADRAAAPDAARRGSAAAVADGGADRRRVHPAARALLLLGMMSFFIDPVDAHRRHVPGHRHHRGRARTRHAGAAAGDAGAARAPAAGQAAWPPAPTCCCRWRSPPSRCARRWAASTWSSSA